MPDQLGGIIFNKINEWNVIVVVDEMICSNARGVKEHVVTECCHIQWRPRLRSFLGIVDFGEQFTHWLHQPLTSFLDVTKGMHHCRRMCDKGRSNMFLDRYRNCVDCLGKNIVLWLHSSTTDQGEVWRIYILCCSQIGRWYVWSTPIEIIDYRFGTTMSCKCRSYFIWILVPVITWNEPFIKSKRGIVKMSIHEKFYQWIMSKQWRLLPQKRCHYEYLVPLVAT